MTETKQLTEQEQSSEVAEQEQPLLTPEELRIQIDRQRKIISRFEEGEEIRAAEWNKRQESAGTDPSIVGAADKEFKSLNSEAQGVLSKADQNLATIGYDGTGEYLFDADGKPSLEVIERIPDPKNKSAEPEPKDVIIGAVQNPDGTWDMSRALRMSDESAKKHNFRWNSDQLIKLYREAYEKDESYRDEGGFKEKFDRAERELKALIATEETAGKAGEYLVGLEMVVDRVIDDNTDMITDVESLDKGTISEDDHKKMAQVYERNNEMFGYVGEKLFPNANCELSAANYDDMLQQMSGITGFTRAENTDVSWYCPESLGPDNMQNILESGDPDKIKLLALHLNTVANEVMIAFRAKAQGLYKENYSYRDEDGSAVRAAEFAYRLRNMTQEAVRLAYNGEEGRTIFDAQKDLFGGQGQEKGSTSDKVEPSQNVGEESEISGEREETSARLDRDLGALRVLSNTGLPDLFGELERVKSGQESAEDFDFIADSLETPMELVSNNKVESESFDRLMQKLSEIQSLCRDSKLSIQEKNGMFVQGLTDVQDILGQEYGVVLQRSEPGSDLDRHSQEVVGIVATDDSSLDGKVAESKWCGFNNPDYTYMTPSGEEKKRMQSVRGERVTIYKYDSSLKQEDEIDGGSEFESIPEEADMGDNANESPKETKTVTENVAGDDIKPDKQAENNPVLTNEMPNNVEGSSAEKTNLERANPYKQIDAIRDKLIEGAEGTWTEGRDELINSLVKILDEADEPYVLKKGIDVFIANGEYDRVPKYLQKAEDNNVISKIYEPDKRALFSCQLAGLAIKCKVPDIARASAEKAEEIADNDKDKKALNRLSEIAHVYIGIGDRDEAERVAGRMDDLGQDVAVGTVRAGIRKRFGSGGFWARVRNRK